MERDEAGRPADPEVVKKAVCQDVVEEGERCRMVPVWGPCSMVYGAVRSFRILEYTKATKQDRQRIVDRFGLRICVEHLEAESWTGEIFTQIIVSILCMKIV